MKAEVWLAAVGDVFINRQGAAAPFDAALPALRAADLRFGNAEGVYCDAPKRAITAGIPVVAGCSQAEALAPVGFDVMSMANNHTMDAGEDGLADTLAALRGLGIAAAGAGMNRAEAHRAAVLAANGQRIAFLAYSAVYRPGYVATDRQPGIAAMRAHTHFYYPDWHPTGQLEPGTRPFVRTFPYPEDLVALAAAIAAERGAGADRVVVSFHWGQTGPSILHDYEHAYARAAIDAGADLVLGHHPHFLRAAAIYRGKPILYGLSHFAFDLGGLERTLGADAIATRQRLDPYGIFPREGYPLLPFHEDARMTAIAFCRFGVDGTVDAALMPCIINRDNQPVPCAADSPQGRQVAAYLERITREQSLPTRYAQGGPTIAGIGTLTVGGA